MPEEEGFVLASECMQEGCQKDAHLSAQPHCPPSMVVVLAIQGIGLRVVQHRMNQDGKLRWAVELQTKLRSDFITRNQLQAGQISLKRPAIPVTIQENV